MPMLLIKTHVIKATAQNQLQNFIYFLLKLLLCLKIPLSNSLIWGKPKVLGRSSNDQHIIDKIYLAQESSTFLMTGRMPRASCRERSNHSHAEAHFASTDTLTDTGPVLPHQSALVGTHHRCFGPPCRNPRARFLESRVCWWCNLGHRNFPGASMQVMRI